MSGKGDGRRPTQIDRATFEAHWLRVFGGRDTREDLREQVSSAISEWPVPHAPPGTPCS